MRYLFSLMVSVVPIILYVVIIKSADKNERQSMKLILLNFLSGALCALILVMITGILLAEGFLHLELNPVNVNPAVSLLFAPLIEEVTKGLMLIIILRNKNLTSVTNGLIYGGAVGLGFGMIENILFFLTTETITKYWILLVINRTFLLSGMHFITTSVFGALIVYSKFRIKPHKFYFMITGILSAILIHFGWNFITERFGITIIPGFLFLTFAVAIFIILFVASNKIEKKLNYLEILEETDSTLISYKNHELVKNGNLKERSFSDDSNRKNIFT